jgi:hypothetical protein
MRTADNFITFYRCGLVEWGQHACSRFEVTHLRHPFVATYAADSYRTASVLRPLLRRKSPCPCPVVKPRSRNRGPRIIGRETVQPRYRITMSEAANAVCKLGEKLLGGASFHREFTRPDLSTLRSRPSVSVCGIRQGPRCRGAYIFEGNAVAKDGKKLSIDPSCSSERGTAISLRQRILLQPGFKPGSRVHRFDSDRITVSPQAIASRRFSHVATGSAAEIRASQVRTAISAVVNTALTREDQPHRLQPRLDAPNGLYRSRELEDFHDKSEIGNCVDTGCVADHRTRHDFRRCAKSFDAARAPTKPSRTTGWRLLRTPFSRAQIVRPIRILLEMSSRIPGA